MFAKPQLCPIFLSLFIFSISFSMEVPNKKPAFPQERSYISEKRYGCEEPVYNEQPYEPKGYFSDEEIIDPSLIDQVIEQAPDYIKAFIDTIQDRNEMLRNVQLQRLLLHGPSGTGKSLLAKVIALLSVGKYYFIQTPDLLDSWKNCHQNLRKEINSLAKIKEPMAIIFDESEQLTDQYKNKNSSDSAMPTAFWSMLDYCRRCFPHFLIIGTTNNRKSDFPPQIISRFAKSNIILIPNPNFEARKQVISYCLNGRKHSLSENDIINFAQGTQNRSCRDIENIINTAIIRAPKNNKIITTREIALAELANPYEPSEDEIIARELGVSIERVDELINMQHIIEKRGTIIEYQQKKNSYDQAAEHQRINNAQSIASYNQSANFQQINHAQSLASYNQTADHHDESLAQSERHHDTSIRQGDAHHNASYAQADQHYIANFNQTANNHTASLNQAAVHHNASLAQAAVHHNASLTQANSHHTLNAIPIPGINFAASTVKNLFK